MPYRKDAPSVEKETTRTTDAETTETKHGTMGVKRERDTLLRTVSRTQSHTHTYGYGHYVLNILRSTLTCLIQTGESCCLRFVGDSRADVIRVHAFLPLWFQSTDPVPDWSCSSYSRVSCPADGRACFV